MLTAGLAGTAAGWYWVFSRHLVPNRTAAAVGGAFCGFAPAMISHGSAHPNFVVLFVLPFIALKTIQIARGERVLRRGIVLGLLVAWQILLGEEALAIFALTFLVFGIAWLVPHRRDLPAIALRLGKGLGAGAAVTLLITGFPLYWQFFGPQSFHSLLQQGVLSNDTAAFTHFATQSVAGVPETAAQLSLNRTEENAFFGWPLVVFMAAVTISVWRDVTARALAIAMYVMAYLSMGAEVVAGHEGTGVPGPWRWLDKLPLLDSVIESRMAMGCIPAIGALLAIATHRVWTTEVRPPEQPDGGHRLPLRLLWAGSLLAILVPIAPKPLVTYERPTTPAFFTDGIWRDYVDDGTLVPVPLPSTARVEPLRWQVEADLGFSMPEGYFVGPWGPDDRRGRYGATPRPTSSLLEEVERTGQIPILTATLQANALTDLQHWDADVLVLAPTGHWPELKATVERLLQADPQFVGGVWVWDTRGLTR